MAVPQGVIEGKTYCEVETQWWGVDWKKCKQGYSVTFLHQNACIKVGVLVRLLGASKAEVYYCVARSASWFTT